jgi:hypothetical protein
MLLYFWPGIGIPINLWCQIWKDNMLEFGAIAWDPSRAAEVSIILWTRCVAMFVMMELQYWLLTLGMHHNSSIINIIISISSFWFFDKGNILIPRWKLWKMKYTLCTCIRDVGWLIELGYLINAIFTVMSSDVSQVFTLLIFNTSETSSALKI